MMLIIFGWLIVFPVLLDLGNEDVTLLGAFAAVWACTLVAAAFVALIHEVERRTGR